MEVRYVYGLEENLVNRPLSGADMCRPSCLLLSPYIIVYPCVDVGG